MNTSPQPRPNSVFKSDLFTSWNQFLVWTITLTLGLATGMLQAQSDRVVITSAANFEISWDGNNGEFNRPGEGAGPSNNVALASSGTVAFGSSEFGVPHLISHINDGVYGNINSWIADFTLPDTNPYIALRFPSEVAVTNIAWGRDNGNTITDSCGGTCTDRYLGVYTLQVTQVAIPDETTEETEDASTGWVTVGTIEYLPGTDDAAFAGYLRHRFAMSLNGAAVMATGLRLKVSDPGIAIDEIEVNPQADSEPPITDFIEVAATPGFTLDWDGNEGVYSTTNSPAPAPINDASADRGAVAFGSSELDFGVHYIPNVNDGFYGNSSAWIPDFSAMPDPFPFIGINFGQPIRISNIAWSRDNGDVAGDCCGGTLTDRALGEYVIQITTVPDPGAMTPEACGIIPSEGWVTVGTVLYKADNPQYFNSHLRHRFNLTQAGNPILATGLRILVPNNQSAIDEIEVNANQALEDNAVQITPALGYEIIWDGNNGHFQDLNAGAAPPLNRALASEGTIPFTSSDLGPELALDYHVATNLNDGLYGNNFSWISANGVGGTDDPDPFAGLNFGELITITNIAWGRDNGNIPEDCCGGTLTDRALGNYQLQFTQVASPDALTPETGDAATGWADLGTVLYASAAEPFFSPHLRHRFDVSSGGFPLEATGIRIKVSTGSEAIDEIEINTPSTAPEFMDPDPLLIEPGFGFEITWDGNDGHYFDPEAGAAPPVNRALSTEGTTAFTSSDLGPLLGIDFHVASNLNDGRYGNSFSWISANGIGGTDDPDPYAALNFNGLVEISNIAWSRDNGDNIEFQGTDRNLGTYTLQITSVPSPDNSTVETGDSFTGWQTIGTVQYLRSEPPIFRSHLRHRFDISSGGFPVEATGLRIKVPNGQIAIDEIEVNTATVDALPKVRIVQAGNEAIISWTGGGGLEVADQVDGLYQCIPTATSPYTISLTEAAMRYFRVRR